MYRFSVGIVLLLLSVTSTIAQRRGVETRCQLTIRVRTAQDRNYDAPARVELLNPAGTPMDVRYTSGAGSADFMVMSGANYRVRVSGDGIETLTTAEFSVLDREQVHMETVNVKLVQAADQQQQQPGPPTISVAEINVPPKAREEMQKGTEAFVRGDMKKAQERFEKAIADYPQYARAYTNLGVIAIKAGDRAKAKEMFAKSIEVNDKFLPGYVNLARMDYQDKNYPEAESLLKKVMALNPSMPDALALLASSEFMNKEYDKALADARRTHALPGHEQFADVHLVAGKVLEMQNHPQDAIEEYQLFLKENPTSPRVPMVQQELAQLQAGKH